MKKQVKKSKKSSLFPYVVLAVTLFVGSFFTISQINKQQSLESKAQATIMNCNVPDLVNTAEEQQALDRINAIRTQRGLRTLAYSEVNKRLSKWFANDIQERNGNQMPGIDSRGRNLQQRVNDCGIVLTMQGEFGETIRVGATVDELIATLERELPNDDNIIYPPFEEAAVSRTGNNWVIVFAHGRPMNSSQVPAAGGGAAPGGGTTAPAGGGTNPGGTAPGTNPVGGTNPGGGGAAPGGTTNPTNPGGGGSNPVGGGTNPGSNPGTTDPGNGGGTLGGGIPIVAPPATGGDDPQAGEEDSPTPCPQTEFSATDNSNSYEDDHRKRKRYGRNGEGNEKGLLEKLIQLLEQLIALLGGGTSPAPVTDPGTDPGTNPETDPGVDPGTGGTGEPTNPC